MTRNDDWLVTGSGDWVSLQHIVYVVARQVEDGKWRNRAYTNPEVSVWLLSLYDTEEEAQRGWIDLIAEPHEEGTCCCFPDRKCPPDGDPQFLGEPE